ncbi:MAG: nitroreductase [Oscillospiraceae bacterium]|nr:nitroreductase [Oscillospiraceae bacterium]
MNILEAIRTRRSVRTFGDALRPEDGQKLLAFAETAGNPYDIPVTWKLLDAKEHGLSSPVIVGTDLYLAGKLPKVPHAEEAFGYSFEKVVLYAQSLGIGTTWIAGTMNRNAFEQAMELSDGEVMPCVSPVGYPAKKLSLREAMMRKGVKADSRLDFGELFFDGSPDQPLTESGAGELAEVLRAVRLAPSAVNRQPWRVVLDGGNAFFYEKPSLGYVSSDGWDIQRIDMGIALCHFDLAAAECGLSYTLEIRDPERTVPEDLHYIATFVPTGSDPAAGLGGTSHE